MLSKLAAITQLKAVMNEQNIEVLSVNKLSM